MRKLCGVLTVAAWFFTVAGAGAVGQGRAQGSDQPTVLRTSPAGGDCPIGISARRGLSAGAVATDKGKPEDRGVPFQQLQILMKNLKAVGVTGAEITAHGTAVGSGQLVPAVNPDGSTASKTVEVRIDVGPGTEKSTDLTLRGFTSVLNLELNSVTFADGTSWHGSAAHACRIDLSKFMLVDGQANH
jgi:hypothetical protein